MEREARIKTKAANDVKIVYRDLERATDVDEIVHLRSEQLRLEAKLARERRRRRTRMGVTLLPTHRVVDGQIEMLPIG